LIEHDLFGKPLHTFRLMLERIIRPSRFAEIAAPLRANRIAMMAC
jgi:hypothetical protein